jgi:hypothetical protein
MVTGWDKLGVTPLTSTLMPRPPLLVNAPPVIDTGDCVLSPSEEVFLMFVRVRVRFSNKRDPVGLAN